MCQCIHAAIKCPSIQFQTGLEQYQVIELLVTIVQKYSAVIGVQVRSTNYLPFLPPPSPPTNTHTNTHTHIHTTAPQVSALSAMGHILSLPLPSLLSLNTYNCLRLIHSAFEAFGTDLAMQEVCCRCLARMMEKNEDLHRFIGRDSPKIQYGAVCVCVCVCMMGENYIGVYVHTCTCTMYRRKGLYRHMYSLLFSVPPVYQGFPSMTPCGWSSLTRQRVLTLKCSSLWLSLCTTS